VVAGLQYPTVNTGSGYTYQEFNVILLSSVLFWL